MTKSQPDKPPAASGLQALTRSTETLEALDLYAQLEGLGPVGELRSPARIEEGLRRLRAGIEDSLSRASRLYGRHVEAMFEALVASLGAVELLKAEDAGDCFARSEVQPPDFRIVTTTGRHLLVEVKNVAPGGVDRGCRLRPRDVAALERYAELTGDELRFALYWSDLNAWSMIPASAFRLVRRKLEISVNDAFRASEMSSLGDVMLGITPPLTWRLIPQRPFVFEEAAGEVEFTIGGTELSFCPGFSRWCSSANGRPHPPGSARTILERIWSPHTLSRAGGSRTREDNVQRDLVERAKRGDRESFGVLANASMARLYNLAQLMLADGDLAEDAVQEALIVTWRDLRGLRDPDRFDSWLYRILVRSVYRVAKSERRQVDRRHLAQSGEWSTPDSAAELGNRDEIDRGFRRLKAEYRAVLVVHHYLGLSDDEAGEVLGVPAGTIKSRLHRATAAMRAELDADTRMGERFAAGTIR